MTETVPTSIPVWFVALVLAAAAPWGVRMLQVALERRLRGRTLGFIAEALAARGPDRGGQRHEATQHDDPEHEQAGEASDSDAPRRP